jgi:uncharacterized membrane protein YgcG
VDLTADWWDLEDMESLRLGKIYPYGRSDFVISAPHVVTFNKTLQTNLNLENPYDLVNAGTWTLDKMLEMGKLASADLNHDGEYSGDDDRFGICTSEVSKFNSFLMSCGQPVSRKNSDGRLELCINTEKTVKIVEMFADAALIGGTLHIDMMDHTRVNMDQLFAPVTMESVIKMIDDREDERLKKLAEERAKKQKQGNKNNSNGMGGFGGFGGLGGMTGGSGMGGSGMGGGSGAGGMRTNTGF